MNKAEELMGTMKVMSDNMRIIHKYVSGKNFLSAHKQIEEYYNYLDEARDDITEILISFGYKEPNLYQSLNAYPAIEDIRTMETYEAYKLCKDYFLRLVTLIEEIKDVNIGIPSDVISQFETYQYQFRKIGAYLLRMELGEPINDADIEEDND